MMPLDGNDMAEIQTLINNIYKEILWNEGTKTLEFHWDEITDKLEFEDYIRETNEFSEYITSLKPVNIIISQEFMKSPLSYEMQNWFLTQQAPIWLRSKLKKIAVVLNHNLHIQHAIDSVVEQAKDMYDTIPHYRFFSDIESARRWITH